MGDTSLGFSHASSMLTDINLGANLIKLFTTVINSAELQTRVLVTYARVEWSVSLRGYTVGSTLACKY